MMRKLRHPQGALSLVLLAGGAAIGGALVYAGSWFAMSAVLAGS